MARRHSEPFVVRPAIGIRLSPRSLRRAPRFGRARETAHEPQDPGLPFRLSPEMFSNERRWMGVKTKNPSGAMLGRGLRDANCRNRLGEIAPMSRACAIEWRLAIRQSFANVVTGCHRSAHVLIANPMFARARCLKRTFRAVNHWMHRFCLHVQKSNSEHGPSSLDVANAFAAAIIFLKLIFPPQPRKRNRNSFCLVRA